MHNKKEELNKQFRNEFYFWEKELRKLINSWGFIPGAPSDEFDALNHKLLSHLNQGANSEKIFNVLRSELISYHGLSPTDKDVQLLTKEVIEWWESYK